MIFRTCLLSAFSFALTSLATLSAQTIFEVPQNVELKTKEDFAKYGPAVVDAEKWIEATDLDKESEKRTQVYAFLMQWITGSPTVTIGISENLTKIFEKNDQFLMIYMAAYSRYIIENKTISTPSFATKAALTSVMSVYKKGKGVSKSKEMEKVIKLTDENKLDAYIKDKLM